jgi:hypothetical protein
MLKRTPPIAIAVVLLVATIAAASPGDPVRSAIDGAADRLVALQNADGGWFWYVDDPDCGLGPGVSCPNLFGVISLGLVEAYRVTHEVADLLAAIEAADALVARHDDAPPCDGNPGTSADRPFTVDSSFLVDVSLVGKVGKIAGQAAKKHYRKVARDWFACVKADFPSAADRADNRIDGRAAQGYSNLGAWDASLDVRAALDVGESDYAVAEALQVITRAPDWDVDDPDCPGCEILSKGLFLAATDELKGHHTIRDTRKLWRDQLLALQLPDGSWGGDTQTTAYVVMGLATMDQRHATRTAISKAVALLLSLRLPSGGFAVAVGDTAENNEVTSEVVQALRAARWGD